MKKFAGIILMAASVISILLSYYIGINIEQEKENTGVRFMENVLDSDKIFQVYDDNKEEKFENIQEITLWRQRREIYIKKDDESSGVPAMVVELWGDIQQVYSESLTEGVYLIKEDVSGCMLSKEAAFQLFGSLDVLGKKVSFEGADYYIRGILNVEEAVIAIQKNKTLFSYMDVRVTPQSGTEPIRQLLLLSGVSIEKGAVLEWDIAIFTVKLFQLLSFGFILTISVGWITKNIVRKKICQLLIKTGALVLFIYITINYCSVPVDLIPARWSDFEFFGEFIKTQKDNYMRCLDLPCIFNDRKLTTQIVNALIAAGASIIWAIVYRTVKRILE